MKMNKRIPSVFTLFTIISCFTQKANAQLQFDYAVTQGSNDTELTGSCRLDNQGGLYMTVAYRDTADLDPGPGIDMVFVAEDEIFVLNKFNEDGQYLWGGQFRTKGDAGGYIAEIKNNSILLIVYYTDSLIYTHGTPWVITNPGYNLAAINLNLEGEILDYRHIANSIDLYFSEFITQDDGSIIAGGGFSNSVTFNTADSTKTLTTVGDDDAFLVRFNAQMELEWITHFAGTGYDFTESVFLGEDGKIYYAVIHDSTVVVQTNHGAVTSPALGEDNSIFGWALPDGSVEAAYIFGGDLGDQLRNIVADTDGNMYINGYYTGSVNFQHPLAPPVIFTDYEEGEGFIAKYYPDGFLDWARIFTNGEYGGVYTMKLHRDTDLYFSGAYNLISDLDPGPDSLIIDGGYDGDLMFGKMNTEGDLAWVYSIEGYSDEGIRNFFPGTDDKVYVHGYYYGDLDCDPGPDSVGILTQGGADVFLIRFTEENVITSTEITSDFIATASPNPATDEFRIMSDSPIDNVQLFSFDGAQMVVPVSYGSNMASLKIDHLVPGFYVARVKSGNNYSTCKIIKS